MNFEAGGKPGYAYTADHAIDPAKRTVVFVHGAGLDHSWFGLQSRYFGYHGRNVLALDLPGHGRSGGAPIATIGGMADWIFSLLDSLHLENVSVVGHSMGALVATELASRHSTRVERIALIGVSYPMKVGEPYLEAAKRDDPAAFDMSTIWGHAAAVPLGGNPNPGMWMYGDTLARLRRLAPGVLHNDLKACNDYQFAGDVQCPALFILGSRDVMTPPRNAKALMEKIPQAKSTVIEGSGHSLMAEAPDATLDALIEFLG